jgi:gamma-glutamyltranspeptidase/glutathione hydrolase
MPGDPQLDTDTVYLTAADGDGNMISFIQSIYYGWGSMICPDQTGFAMQNRGLGFSLDPEHPNRLEPHKRPFHTIIPGFVTRDWQPVLSFGVMGGDFQPQGHCQVLMNMLDFGMSPQQAGDQPRIGHDGSSDPAGRYTSGGGVLSLEHGIEAAVKRKLLAMGHRDSGANVALGGYQAIWRRENPRVYLGGSDPRRDGCAIGY